MTRLSLAVVVSLLGPIQAGSQEPRKPPSLIVLITVDQLRGDYIQRFQSQLTGGLARLARGAWFTNAHHDHAITETAPGHATLLSGRFPRSTGIADNLAGVDDPAAPLLGASGPGASPARFQGTTLVDWLRARDPNTRVLSVSMKDRGAILPVGRSRSEVYWYSTDGRFTTSQYYRPALPGWVDRFNARRLPQSFAGKSWTPLLPDSAYKEVDAESVERAGADYVFPHVVSADAGAAASEIRVTPWMDEITFAFALEGLRELALGDGSRTDVLAVSVSATDIIGHSFGPDSKEIHDQLLRLDRLLGAFIDSVYRMRDSSRVVFALSADHGVGRIPEIAARTQRPPPYRVDVVAPARAFHAKLLSLGLDTSDIEIGVRTVRIQKAARGTKGREIDAALAAYAAELRRIPGVARVDRLRDLSDRDTLADPIARRWSHQFADTSTIELVTTLTPSSIYGRIVATHGSPYDYDSHVPVIFYGAPFRPGRYTDFVRTVDLAPTLAAVAGVTPSERLDGVALKQAIR
jgi:hypothetical protein